MPSWKDLPTVDASVDGHVVTFKPIKQNPVARYAYHVTFSKNLAAISKRGLVPGSRSAMGRGGYAGHSGGKTFLSDKEGVDF